MAPRRTTSPPPPRAAVLTDAQKRDAIPRLEKRAMEVREFDMGSVKDTSDPALIALGQAIDRTLVHIFGADTVEYQRYAEIQHFARYAFNDATTIEYLAKDKDKAVAVLYGIIAGFREDLNEFQPGPPNKPGGSMLEARSLASSKVFVVHGHDSAALQEVARFLERLELKAIILNEQPDQGRTIIEKFEACAGEVGFAVILLTPDDVVEAPSTNRNTARARQNVIFELGYFAGKLGRGRACLLRRGEVEIPSDLHGVVYKHLDAAGGWKLQLAQEMKAAGLKFDANKVIG